MKQIFKKPPRIAKWMLGRIILKQNFSPILGDFEEIYIDIQKSKGKIIADLWYWYQILKSAPTIIYNSILIGGLMIISYFKLAIRNIKKYKTFSFINIAGLSVSLTLCLLIIKILISIYSTDAFHEQRENIYRITTTVIDKKYNLPNNFATAPLPLAQKLEEYASIEKVVRIKNNFGGNVLSGNEIISIKGLYADQEFFDVFSFKLFHGDITNALASPNSLVISEKLSMKLFGLPNSVGKTVSIANLGEFNITGIIEDISTLQSSLRFECLASFSTLYRLEQEEKIYSSLENWHNINDNYIYFMMKSGASPHALFKDFGRIANENIKDERFRFGFNLQTLADISPGDDLSNEISATVPFTLVVILIFFGMIILVTAGINYANLSIARALNRTKEIGIRKVIGANRINIFIQFIAESVAISLIALIIAFILLYLAEPLFYAIHPDVRTTFNLSDIDQVSVIISFFAFSLFTGIISGFIPALYISKFKPVEILRNVMNKRIFSRLTLRKGLIAFQMFLSVLFIITALNGYTQISFIKKYDYGFRSENIINVKLQDANYETFKNEIEVNPNIYGISASAYVPLTGITWIETCRLADAAESMDINTLSIDENFIGNLNLTVLAGKNFSGLTPAANYNSVLLNESAVKKLGFSNPIDALDKSIKFGKDEVTRVIGILKDFHYTDFEREIEPLAIRYIPKNFRYANLVVNPINIKSTIDFLEAKWKIVSPSDLFIYKHYDQELAELFSYPQIMITAIGVIAFLSILIASFGLLGMVIFDTENRIREIGIRKVLGASIGNVTLTLANSFLIMFTAASLLAFPFAWIINSLILQEIAVHTPMSFSLFLISFIGMLLIGTIIVLPKTIKAASSNPVDSIKYE